MLRRLLPILACVSTCLCTRLPTLAESPPVQSPGKVQELPVNEAAGILGRPVHDAEGQEVGRIIDVIVDQTGRPRAAVIDFGGFMGVGSRKVAVDWSTLHFAPGDRANPVSLDLTPDQIKAAPEYHYDADRPATVVKRGGAS